MLVLVAIALATWLLIPGRRGREIGGDVIGAALYVVNWVLAGRSVDYLAKDTLPSPVQHYWSLAVEEQFYVVWPLCLVLLVLVPEAVGAAPARPGPGPQPQPAGDRCAAGRAGGAVAGLLRRGTPSPCRRTPTSPPRPASGSSASGAALAVWAVDQHPHRVRFAAPLGWAGLVLIVGTAVLLPERGRVARGLGAAAHPGHGGGDPVRLGRGATRPRPAAGALRPLVWVGALSYSLYLWHWPFAVFAQEMLGSRLGEGVGGARQRRPRLARLPAGRAARAPHPPAGAEHPGAR